MKFTVEQSALTDGVNWVSRSLSTRPIKTELLGIVIDATINEVFLSASQAASDKTEYRCIRWAWSGDVYNRKVVCLEWVKVVRK